MFHQAVICDDCIEPRAEFRFPVERPQFPKNIHERVLKILGGFVGVTANPVRKPVHGIFVASDEFCEGDIVAVSCYADEFVVRKMAWRPGAQRCDAIVWAEESEMSLKISKCPGEPQV